MVQTTSRCLMFKQDDTILFATLPNGEHLFMAEETMVEGHPELTASSFTAPDDIPAPIKLVVNVGAPNIIGADNRAFCEQRIIPNGGTLTFNGERFEVV